MTDNDYCGARVVIFTYPGRDTVPQEFDVPCQLPTGHGGPHLSRIHPAFDFTVEVSNVAGWHVAFWGKS